MNSEIGEARIKCIYDSIFRPCVCWGLNMGQGRGGPQSATLVPILLQFERTWQVVSGGRKYRQGHNERYPANTVNRSPTTNDDPYSRHTKCLRGCIFTIQNSHTWVTHDWIPKLWLHENYCILLFLTRLWTKTLSNWALAKRNLTHRSNASQPA